MQNSIRKYIVSLLQQNAIEEEANSEQDSGMSCIKTLTEGTGMDPWVAGRTGWF